MSEIKLNTIEEAIEDFRDGKFLIVVDDEDRENEGDFIVAAEKITPEKVNFMLTYGRGVLCAPITEERCRELDLEMQGKHRRQVGPDQYQRVCRSIALESGNQKGERTKRERPNGKPGNRETDRKNHRTLPSYS
jgi:3,4-dihydroxy-2-butanone 4-phosphate synthase